MAISRMKKRRALYLPLTSSIFPQLQRVASSDFSRKRRTTFIIEYSSFLHARSFTFTTTCLEELGSMPWRPVYALPTATPWTHPTHLVYPCVMPYPQPCAQPRDRLRSRQAVQSERLRGSRQRRVTSERLTLDVTRVIHEETTTSSNGSRYAEIASLSGGMKFSNGRIRNGTTKPSN